MIFLNNKSQFSAELFSFPDVSAQEIAVLVVSAAFIQADKGRWIPRDPQPPVRVADKYFGDPALSSLRYEADTAPSKPSVDIILNAAAHAPGGRPCRSVVVELHVADIHKKLLVQGDRLKSWLPFGKWITRSKPFLTMPIVYERSYGGAKTVGSDAKMSLTYPWNPVGFGFKGLTARDSSVLSHLENISYFEWGARPHKKIPAGFGAVARSWRPRIDYAGTFDEVWLAKQWPLLPLDFDVLHYQAAPLDQQSRSIVEGDLVMLKNLTPEGEWKFKLPRLNLPAHLLFADRRASVALRMDTVLIEPECKAVTLSYRRAIPIERNKPLLKEVVLGHMESAWFRAKEKRKQYWDLRGNAGVDISQPMYL